MFFIGYILLLSLTVVAKDHEDFTNQDPNGLQVPVEAVMSPWTHEPECDLTGSTDFCLYTNANFSHGRGISIIAKRKTVVSIEWLELFTKSAKIDRINPKEDLPYHEVAIPGKGMGLVAHRTILAGEPIAIWTPLLVEYETASTSLSAVALLSLRGLAIKRLSAKSQKLFLAQHRQWGGHDVSDIMATNAFRFTDFGGLGGENSATFPEISRINHACRPNIAYRFDSRKLVQSTFASRTIHPGEELSISYTGTMRPRNERMHSLLEGWGFTCTCSHCSRPLTEIDQSDERIKRIDAISETCAYGWGREDLDCNLDTAIELVLLYQQENTGGDELAFAYEQARLAAEAYGLHDLVSKYSELSLGTGPLSWSSEL